jgi:hypothetical protein
MFEPEWLGAPEISAITLINLETIEDWQDRNPDDLPVLPALTGGKRVQWSDEAYESLRRFISP